MPTPTGGAVWPRRSCAASDRCRQGWLQQGATPVAQAPRGGRSPPPLHDVGVRGRSRGFPPISPRPSRRDADPALEGAADQAEPPSRHVVVTRDRDRSATVEPQEHVAGGPADGRHRRTLPEDEWGVTRPHFDRRGTHRASSTPVAVRRSRFRQCRRVPWRARSGRASTQARQRRRSHGWPTRWRPSCARTRATPGPS